MSDIRLVLGGARSGKSNYAEKLATEMTFPITYIATAQVCDDEFKARIQYHKDIRPASWSLVEELHRLDDALARVTAPNQCVIIDCLTLWLAQWICADCNPPKNLSWQSEHDAFLKLLPYLAGTITLVSNEVGMGIVPLGEIKRQFQDEQGRLNQAVAAIADKVCFISAGLPIMLKG